MQLLQVSAGLCDIIQSDDPQQFAAAWTGMVQPS